MPLLSCLDPHDPQDHKRSGMWITGFTLIDLAYLGAFLYSIIPLYRYFQEFKQLSRPNKLTRVSFSVTLFLKFLGTLVTLFIGCLKANGQNPNDYNFFVSIVGIFFLELPCYLVATSFAAILLAWLSMCFEILPSKYEKAYVIAKYLFIAYNVVFYALFIASVVIEFIRNDPKYKVIIKDDDNTPAIVNIEYVFSGVVAIVRDLLLCAMMAIFVVILRKGLKEDQYSDVSKDEKRLYWSTVILSLFLLLRGLASLLQGYYFIPNGLDYECGYSFYFIFLFTELLNQALPLIYLLYINNGFLFQQRRMSINQSIIESPS